MTLPAAVQHVTDALADVDRVFLELLDGPGVPAGMGPIVISYADAARRAMDDILALYPEFAPTRDEEEIWHQASL